ncbi:PaaI family thioesterase [Phenylobacterium montanum]|uniref:PaaI family thioesterase n=1 Tax=Phenylobacterium montanum TaxID=2823693 RepID=A0A975IXN6_9CAUL|nr:PaaI family thioesterase [Caulobacter sp. S6]
MNAQPLPLAKLLGIELVEASKTKVIARLVVRDEICTAGGILHGGAFMTLADTAGAVGAHLNLPEGARTTTIESKTNFLGSATVGTLVTAEATPVHVGRRSSVWQTRITAPDGKLLALVVQTQMVI